MGTAINPFVVLGVDANASRGEIEEAYRRRVAALHPDRFAGSSAKVLAAVEERLDEAALAYHLLTDDEARLEFLHDASTAQSRPEVAPWVAVGENRHRQRVRPVADHDLQGIRARRVVVLRTWQTPTFLLLVFLAIVVMVVVQQSFAG